MSRIKFAGCLVAAGALVVITSRDTAPPDSGTP